MSVEIVEVPVEVVEVCEELSVLSSDSEIWSYLTKLENQEDESGKKLDKVLSRIGMSGPSDIAMISNMPREQGMVLSCLKAMPGKRLKSILGERSVTKKAPFCPICRDAGKSAEEYTSHHIWKDETREEVICPTLLSHTCERCGESGHMPRYCPKGRMSRVSERSPESVAESVSESSENKEEEKVKHCKVCYQAGFGVEVYSSHYTKVDEVIMCPTILNNKCHRCGGTGHTPKYCTVTVRVPLREERLSVPRHEERREERLIVPRREEREERRSIQRSEVRRDERREERRSEMSREERRREERRMEDLSKYKNGLNEVSIYLENAKRSESKEEMGMWMDRALRLQHNIMSDMYPVRR